MKPCRSFCFMVLFLLAAFVARAQHKNPFGNPLIPDMIADASIQVIDGVFYCYATTDGFDKGLETSGPPVVWVSKDFVHWSFSGTYFPSAFKEKYWAPSKVVKKGIHYYIYPTVNQYMYAAVATSPLGPFKLASGPDTFYKPFSAYTLLSSRNPKNPEGIDAEIFVDSNQQAYIYWQKRKAAKLNADMITIDSNHIIIETPHKEYSEGPIFFQRNNIYYYLYTIGGDEKYTYRYVMSKTSPLGPFEAPASGKDLVCETDYTIQLYGPGHGSVFTVPGTNDFYLAYLEYGRGSTNRQTYVNKLLFNDDGTIQQVVLTMKGVGAMKKSTAGSRKRVVNAFASSIRDSLVIPKTKDSSFRRVEYFDIDFAFDGANGSRWMAKKEDDQNWMVIDLGKPVLLSKSELYFVRPTAGHAYGLDYSMDGKNWKQAGGHADLRLQSPHVDSLKIKARYLRVRITEGVAGIWEWNVY